MANTTSSTTTSFYTAQYIGEYLTTGIGPKVKYCFFPKSLAEIKDAIDYIRANDLEYYVIGGGSNTLIDDTLDENRAVICLKDFTGIQALENYNVRINAGTTLQEVIDYAQSNNLVGVTGMNRIPGSVGGAVLGNAGAYGTEICQTVVSVTFLDLRDLSIQTFDNEKCEFGYRDSYFKKNLQYLILDVVLGFKKVEDYTAEKLRYEEIALFRDAIYPKGYKSPGSVFKNFPVDTVPKSVLDNMKPEWLVHNKLSVGAVLQSLDSNGFQVGGVKMTDRHANIMVVIPPATFNNAETLVHTLQFKAKEKYNLDIEPEIRLVTQFRKL